VTYGNPSRQWNPVIGGRYFFCRRYCYSYYRDVELMLETEEEKEVRGVPAVVGKRGEWSVSTGAKETG